MGTYTTFASLFFLIRMRIKPVASYPWTWHPYLSRQRIEIQTALACNLCFISDTKLQIWSTTLNHAGCFKKVNIWPYSYYHMFGQKMNAPLLYWTFLTMPSVKQSHRTFPVVNTISLFAGQACTLYLHVPSWFFKDLQRLTKNICIKSVRFVLFSLS